MKNIDEAVFLGEQTRGCTAPQCEERKGDDILQGKSTSDALVLVAGVERVAVYEKQHSDHNVGVVYASQQGHQPGRTFQDESLNG